MLFATFSVGGSAYAVDALRVQEALRSQPLTAVPLAPPAIRGLMNLRGQLVTGLDLHRILGAPTPPEHDAMNLVVDGPTGPISLQVDAIGDVLETDEPLSPVPSSVPGERRHLIDGVCALPDALMVVLNIDAIDEAAHRHHLLAPADTTNQLQYGNE